MEAGGSGRWPGQPLGKGGGGRGRDAQDAEGWATAEGRGRGGIQDEVHSSGPRTGEWCGHPSDRHPRGEGRFKGTEVEGRRRVS